MTTYEDDRFNAQKDKMVQNKDKIVSELKSGVDDAQGFLNAAAASTGEKAAELRDKATAALKRASESLSDLQATVIEKGRDAAIMTDDYVHENPWQAIGIGASIGFLVGVVVARR
jgi:ElaB/YqjD/DUF883 family membrane-anchored ribosome-binding protein